MKLIIAEKAIAARRIAEILAGKKVALQTISRAQAFPFEKDGEEQIVVPLRGHVMDVDFPKQYSYWLGTDLRKLNKAEVVYNETEKAIFSALKKLAPDATQVIIATDADKEGEAIGVEAIQAIQKKNKKVEIKRAYFSAITPTDIKKSFSHLDKVDYPLADSANARREIDLIWGAVLTRFLSLVSGRLGKEFLSAGRVQTPVLALIVDREKERLAFKSHKYWELNALFEKDKSKFSAMHKKGRFLKKEDAEAVLKKKTEKCLVTRVTKKERKLPKPTPFNTTAFQRAAAATGITIGEAMSIAEGLYQEGYISYPRTDNSTYPSTLDLAATLNELVKIPEFAPLVEKIFSLGELSPSRGKETRDHPPIYPVSAAPKTKLPEKHWKIYELIVRRFLATLSEEALTLNTTAEIDMNKEPFVARGQIIKKLGWKEFYPYSTIKEVILPDLKRGDVVKLLELKMDEKETQPPTRYSQATLIKLMEQNGLGTKATRHEIIKKLYFRQYISGIKSIEPNKIAFAVIDSLEKHAEHATKPKMTSELEQEMEQIAADKKTKDEVVDDSRKYLSQLLDELLAHKDAIGKELRQAVREDSIVGKCTACDGNLRILKGRSGKRFLGCTSYPKCTETYPLPQKGKLITTEKLCEHCGKPVIKIIGKHYRYEMCIYPSCISKKDWGKKKKEKEERKENKTKETNKEEENSNNESASRNEK